MRTLANDGLEISGDIDAASDCRRLQYVHVVPGLTEAVVCIMNDQRREQASLDRAGGEDGSVANTTICIERKNKRGD